MVVRNLKQLLLELFAVEHLLTATQCREQLEKQGRRFNKTSIYRALDQLVADALLCRQNFQSDEVVYELRQSHHAHLVCENCGTVTSASCTYVQPIAVDGFQVDHHHVTLLGTCKNCVTSKKI